MSNSEPEKRTVRLIAEADEGTEIFVIDGSYRRLDSALNRMQVDLSPGLYTVKFKRGDALTEIDADLLPGSEPVMVKAPPNELAFAAAAPMQQTSTSHEYHQAAAARLSRMEAVPIGSGRGGRLFFFVRDIGINGVGNPAGGMTLHDRRGRKVVDFGMFGDVLHDQDPAHAACYGCNVEIDPGFYRLRVPRSGLPGLEQSLILLKDWQLQVFLARGDREAKGPAGTIDLSDGTMLMTRPGMGFDPSEPASRLTELARQGLTSGRIPVSEEDLRQMLWGKFENPMLGLLSAHLLIPLLRDRQASSFHHASEIAKEYRTVQRVLGITADGIVGPQTLHRLRHLLEEVVGNLENLLGDHPDVNAIRLRLSGNESPAAEAGRAGIPPMLRKSWEALVRLDSTYRFAKAGSITERIADRIWGTGAWLMWQVPPATSRGKALDPERVRRLASRIDGSTAEAVDRLLLKAGLSPWEESLVRGGLKKVGITTRRRAAVPAAPSQTDVSAFEPGKPEEARRLGIPYMTLKRNLASAITKIDDVVESDRDLLRRVTKNKPKP